MSAEKEAATHTAVARFDSPDREAGGGLEYERRIIHKVDWHLLPTLIALYSVALIDRINMSNANVAGMRLDLGLHIGERYSIALLVFFIPYFLFELPSNVLLRKVGAAMWLGSIALAWGVVTIGMGFVESWKTLAVCRTFLGFFEAGFFPGCVYLVSCWYCRFEVQKRMAGFYLGTLLIGSFASILAFGLMQMEGTAGIRGWRWIFIIEGVLTCAIALVAFFTVIDFPDKVLKKRSGRFLTAEDVAMIKARIDRDRDDSIADPITWRKVCYHLSDFKLWVFALLFMAVAMPSYAFAYFMPIIFEGMGWKAEKAQLMSAPPSVFTCAVGLAFAALADRMRMRGPVIVMMACMCIIGLLTTAYSTNTNARYFGTFLGIAGSQGNVPSVLAYQSNNIRMNSKRSVGSALQVGFGAIGGIFASTVFRAVDAPNYLPGLWASVACQLFLILGVGGMTVYFKAMNRQQKEGRQLEEHPDFTYTL